MTMAEAATDGLKRFSNLQQHGIYRNLDDLGSPYFRDSMHSRVFINLACRPVGPVRPRQELYALRPRWMRGHLWELVIVSVRATI